MDILLKTRHLLIFSALLFVSTQLSAQAREDQGSPKDQPIKEKGFDMDRLVVGGAGGATFGDITYIDIAPTVGYLLTDNFMPGVGARYIYYEDRLFNFKTNIYGANVFTQYFILENFIAHAEVELISLENQFRLGERINLYNYYVGGGYRSMMGGNSFFSILMLFNLNEDDAFQRQNPIIRMGVGIGL